MVDLSGDYLLGADIGLRTPLYTNIRLTRRKTGYWTMWTPFQHRDNTQKSDSSMLTSFDISEQWVRDGVWVLKLPQRVLLPSGI